ESAGAAGEDGVLRVVTSRGIDGDNTLSPALHVERHKPNEIRTAVRPHINLLAVRVELGRPAGIGYRTGVERRIARLIDAIELDIAVFKQAPDQLQIAITIKAPLHDAVIVLAHQFALGRGNLHQIEIAPGRVPVVEADIDFVGS